ncbi:3-hydroxyacyl-CoA dehydrogenase NAD-binding domain-containing protein [Pseudorhizobium flavum]|uniref:3-hydroxyacyl-CoA dehydrogenase NAD-binding domain-containing protein n=1 Tax=Pseudorhizobium flavum TaxID=1335061 RepID=UPI0024918CD1|nr:3-hydroxyacyl-CoA dehydrogenase NAD-binding domain-containing protein [Pseudorhizobium flavum]
MSPQDIKSVTVVGTGTIGASWTCLFLAHGLDVVATDIREGAAKELEVSVERCWSSLPQAVLEKNKRGTLRYTTDLSEACRGTGFVQENAIERVEEKIELMRRIDAATSPGVVVASSSSAISVTDMQSACAYPERVVLGHPFNPPHLVPLVEMVGGARTGEAALRSAEQLYQRMGKTTIRLQKEIYGHVANRLQAAIFREAIHMLESGVASAEDIDRAVTDGPGLRWALMGPLLTYRLAGGDRGMQGFWDMFAPMQDKLWRELGMPLPDEDLQQRVTAAVDGAYAALPVDEVVWERDARLRQILAMRRSRKPG